MKAPQEFTTGYCAREAVQQHKSHQTLANCPTVCGKSQQTLWHIRKRALISLSLENTVRYRSTPAT